MTGKPMVPVVLGSGPMADAMRAQIAADPDRYRPTSISMYPAGTCPCCGADVYRVRSRLTDFEEGYATGTEVDALLHPTLKDGAGDRIGPGCCCSEGAWGPKHAKQGRKRK